MFEMNQYARSIVTLVVFVLWSPASVGEVPENKESFKFTLAPVVKKASKAVVNVYATKMRAATPNHLLFRDFFGDAFPMSPLPSRVHSSLGSGVFLRQDGLIVTNYHVIENADKIRVVTADQDEFDAKILVRDPRVDLAILKITGKDFPTLELAPMHELEVGDFVCAIGNPFGLGQTVTVGCISALARDGFVSHDPRVFIQTDAAVNRGNSGGALVTTDGKLAAINAFIFSKNGGSMGLSFAIPTNFLPSLIAAADMDGVVQRPWLGASYRELSAEQRAAYQIDKRQGILLTEIFAEGPAANAGLRLGDVVIKVNNYPVLSESYFRFMISTSLIGSTLVLTVVGSDQVEREVKVMLLPPPVVHIKSKLFKERTPLRGLTVAQLTPQLADQFNLEYTPEKLVVVGVKPLSVSSNVGFQEGDLLEEINEMTLRTIEDIDKSLQRKSYGWSVTFVRNNLRQTILVK